MYPTEIDLSAGKRWAIAARRAGTHALIVWPPLFVAFMIAVSLQKGSLALDLTQAYIPAAHKILHGISPFPPLTVKAIEPKNAFIYPPLTAWLVAPFTLLPVSVAEALGIAMMIAAVVGLLLLLDVRDWRCHMIAFLWVPTYSAVQTANLALPVALGVAALWRLRNRPMAAGVVAGALVALKLYVWPLGVWLLVTRRYRHLGVAALTAVALVVASWGAIGFTGLGQYPRLLQLVTRVEGPQEYTIRALLGPVLSWRAADLVVAALGFAALAVTRRIVRLGDERAAYICAIGATLLLSPIVHMSYFVILLVPIALHVRRLSPLWALPLVLWVGPQITNGRPWQTATVLAAVALTFTIAGRTPQPTKGGALALQAR